MERTYTREQIEKAIRMTFSMDEVFGMPNGGVAVAQKDDKFVEQEYRRLFNDFFGNLNSQIYGN